MHKLYRCNSCRKFFDYTGKDKCPFCGKTDVIEYWQPSTNMKTASELNAIEDEATEYNNTMNKKINDFENVKPCTFQELHRDDIIYCSLTHTRTAWGYAEVRGDYRTLNSDGFVTGDSNMFQCNIEKCPIYQAWKKKE